jgi:hypothetical protein
MKLLANYEKGLKGYTYLQINQTATGRISDSRRNARRTTES